MSPPPQKKKCPQDLPWSKSIPNLSIMTFQSYFGEVSVPVPVVGVEGQLCLLVQICLPGVMLLLLLMSGGPAPRVHLHKLLEGDAAVAVLVVAGDRALDPLAV